MIPSVGFMISKGDGCFPDRLIMALFGEQKIRKEKEGNDEKGDHHAHQHDPLSSRMPREILIAPLSSVSS